MSYLQSLMRYKLWANELLYGTVSELQDEELHAARPIVFGSLARTLNHTYAMDKVWQHNLLGEPHGLMTRNPSDCPDLQTLRAAQSDLDLWYVRYTEALSEADREELINFTFIGGNAGAMSRQDVLIHVVNHGTYHRGNVTGMLYESSVEPPTTDYSVFLTRTRHSNGA